MPGKDQGVVVCVYEPKPQQTAPAIAIHLLVCSLSVSKHLIFEPADCGTGARRPSGSKLPCRRFTGKSDHGGTCVDMLLQIVCKYSL